MEESKRRTWKYIYIGMIAEGAICPYCGKRGYDNDDNCKHCGMHVAPRIRIKKGSM